MAEQIRPRPRTREGVVVSNGADKTAVVSVRRRVRHPNYRKIIERSTKYIVHDERNECQVGDKVLISEARPISKRKRWRLSKVLERSLETAVEERGVEG